jgi:hypothetical protein
MSRSLGFVIAALLFGSIGYSGGANQNPKYCAINPLPDSVTCGSKTGVIDDNEQINAVTVNIPALSSGNPDKTYRFNFPTDRPVKNYEEADSHPDILIEVVEGIAKTESWSRIHKLQVLSHLKKDPDFIQVIGVTTVNVPVLKNENPSSAVAFTPTDQSSTESETLLRKNLDDESCVYKNLKTIVIKRGSKCGNLIGNACLGALSCKMNSGIPVVVDNVGCISSLSSFPNVETGCPAPVECLKQSATCQITIDSSNALIAPTDNPLRAPYGGPSMSDE